MDSQPLGREPLSAEVRAWHVAFADAVASRDAAHYVSFMHEDCSVQVNNTMPVYSKLAIGAAYTEYLQAFRDLSYEVLNVFGTDRQSVAETLFTYVCKDGSTVVVQHAYVVERDEGGLITAVRVYGDNSRLLTPPLVAND